MISIKEMLKLKEEKIFFSFIYFRFVIISGKYNQYLKNEIERKREDNELHD